MRIHLTLVGLMVLLCAPSSIAMAQEGFWRKCWTFFRPGVVDTYVTESTLKEILASPPTLKSWWCDAGCIPYSEQLYARLQSEAPGVWRLAWAQLSDPSVKIGGKTVKIIAGHQFLVKEHNRGSAEEVIIDPTIRQFFSRFGRRRIPHVFVGTRRELIELFRKHKNDIRVRPKFGEKNELNGVDPDEFVSLMYGITAGREYVMPGDV